ncbi:hypothetical protein I4I73_24405 [Pseudonocardia sp. KRD-184]|uniref:Uncharacterized protein n=1 Tax=Pseudonocardia oceani TaxID=2792013 RepID=A0ABS6UHE6_9PSEU|nr:hypothetical protein [Pseudonocardia oceani]MBW0092172.1 hypothetical protein [Pseudonocardia oceani]MBW0099140.1 hypothetical protein [Pseudonocardia oceani]MBW0109386.1 hypothetical protein [Pseudonocardia oceani]MBW0122515.1 hypothetical protein [Pseudonocardia oceani]MBW0131665.1 hypothetical protein [Pseudonocardia oceani]
MLTRTLTTAALALGFVVSLIGAVATPSALPACVGVGVAAGMTAPILSDAARATPLPRARRRRTGWRTGAVTTGFLLALTGSVTLFGPAAGTGLAPVLAVGWWLRCRDGAEWPDRTTARERPAAAPDAVDPAFCAMVGDATTTELRQAWQRAWFAIADLPLGPLRHRVADLRAEILDELERRHPDHVRLWLETGGRANGDPLRFLGAEQDP